MTRRLLAAVAAVLLLAACSGGDSDTDGGGGDGGSDATLIPPASESAPDGTDDEGVAPVEPTGDLADCPAGFDEGGLPAGEHEGFASGGQERAFHLLVPEDAPAEPAPLFVALTGTVQEEADFLTQSEIDRLTEDGWIVVAPVRNGNGLVWGPWDAMRTPAMTGPNPDEALVLALVGCVAAHHPVDADRVFVGGISIGGTFTNYLLRRHSDVFAGGIVGSGNLILTEPAEREPIEAMTVIVAWGGPDDQWTGCPDGRMGEQYADEPGCVSTDFVADAAAATELYAEEPEVAVLACSEDVGHIWMTSATSWWAEVLAGRPKGTTAPLDPGAPPPPMTCEADPT